MVQIFKGVQNKELVLKAEYDKLAAELSKEQEHSSNFERDANLYHEKCEAAEARIAEEEKLTDSYRKKWTDEVGNNADAGKKIIELEAELAAIRGAAVPVFEVEMSDGYWLNIGPIAGADLGVLPNGINKLFTHPAPAIVGEAVPVAYTDNEELELLKTPNSCADMWDKPYGFGRDIPLFTHPAPPVVVLPEIEGTTKVVIAFKDKSKNQYMRCNFRYTKGEESFFYDDERISLTLLSDDFEYVLSPFVKSADGEG